MSPSPTVLVVDDEPANLAVAEAALSPLGYTVVTAGDATTATRRMRAALPDLVLLDAVMPGESGIEICRRWRSRAEWRNVPVILLSSLTSDSYRRIGLAAGADGYLDKPLDPKAIVRLAARWLPQGCCA